MPKQIATATMEGTRKKGRPCKRWRDKVEEDLNVMQIRNGGSGREKWGMEEDFLEAKVCNRTECLRRRSRRRRTGIFPPKSICTSEFTISN
jgi:hypothetical protein